MIPMTRWVFAALGLLGCACAPAIATAARDGVDYAGLYAAGISFPDFLSTVRARRDQWQAHYNDATVSADLLTRMRALPARRRILVVAEDYCLDSANTIPYIARLVDAVPERLAMRVVDAAQGRTIMEAHRTPDGRTATPTIAILDERGNLIAAWTERPASTQTWFLEQQKVIMQKPLHDQLEAWYAGDAGKTTVAEIAELLTR